MQEFFDELLDYMYVTFFSFSFNDYANLDWKDPRPSIPLVLLGVCIGVAIAAVATVYNKRTLGSFVRALLKTESFSEDKAKTLSELGVSHTIGLRRALCMRDNPLRKTVRYVGEGQPEVANANEATGETTADKENEFTQPKVAEDAQKDANGANKEGKRKHKWGSDSYMRDEFDFETTRFYIPEDLKYHAEVRFDDRGSSWKIVILTILGLVVCYFLVLGLLPKFFSLLNDFAGWAQSL